MLKYSEKYYIFQQKDKNSFKLINFQDMNDFLLFEANGNEFTDIYHLFFIQNTNSIIILSIEAFLTYQLISVNFLTKEINKLGTFKSYYITVNEQS